MSSSLVKLVSVTKKGVPKFQLDVLAKALSPTQGTGLYVFVLDQRVQRPEVTFGFSYRSNYYGAGICLRGEAAIEADLEDFIFRPRSVLAMAPQAIKRWRHMSEDFEHTCLKAS